MRKAGATIFIGDPVASVRVFAKLAVKPRAAAFLIRLYRERWGRTPHKVTTGTGVPKLFHTGASVPFLLVYWRFAHFLGDKRAANTNCSGKQVWVE